MWRWFFLEQIAILVDSRVVLRGGVKDRERMTLRTNLWLFNIAMENGSFIDGLPGFTY